MNLSENLRVLREKNGMTQEQLAEKMEVSRQTISKWESGGSFPETEKMLQLTELFGCTLDGLLKGNLEKEVQKEAEAYENHQNRMSRGIALGVFLLIFGTALEAACEFLLPSGSTGICILLFATMGVALLVKHGMDDDHFKKKHPYIEPFYTEEVLEDFHRKFTTVMTSAVAALIGSLIVVIVLTEFPLLAGIPYIEDMAGSVFLVIVACAVAAIVYIAMQSGKYDVEKYNKENAWENSEEGKENGRRIGKACGIIMCIAAAAYIGASAVTNLWGQLWWIWAVGGVLCGVAVIVLNKKRD